MPLPQMLPRARGAAISDRRTLLAPATLSPARLGQIALGLIWCLDGVLKLRPYFFHHFVTAVVDPSAAGQPGVIGQPVMWFADLIRPHQAIFVALAILGEVLIGVGLLVRRTVKPALVLSFVWALNVWVTGEGLGFLFTGTTPAPLTGILGTAPLYIVAGLLVWPRGTRAAEEGPTFGVLGEHGARIVWAALWLSAAVLWLFPSNADPNAVSTVFTSAPSGAGWLSSLQSGAASFVGGSGMTVAVVLAVLSAEIGLSVLLRRGTRVALIASMGISLAFWFLAEGLGGVFTGQATDVGTGPLMILIAALLLPLAGARTTVTSPARMRVSPAGQT
jgi:hypothetical protein